MNFTAFFANAQSSVGSYESSLPPVHLWNPSHCGDIDIHIDHTGAWNHDGKPIRRQAIINLFSTVLKIENGEYFLVTPQEKCRIKVDVAPLLIVSCDVESQARDEQTLTFHTAQGQSVIANKHHTLNTVQFNSREYPTIHIRDGLNALISRNVYYQLSDLFETYDADTMRGDLLLSEHQQNPNLDGAIVLRSAKCIFALHFE